MNFSRVLRSGASSVRNRWASRLAFTAAIVAVTLVRADAVPGILDPSFGFDGRVLSTVNADPAAIAIDHLGRMVVVGTRKVNGHSQIVVARFDPPDAVSLDLNFGDFGIAIGNFGGNNVDNVAVGVAIDDVNRVIVAGNTTFGAGDRDFLIARFTAQGVPDVTFNPGGTIGFRAYGMGGQDEARAMAVDSPRRIVVVGSRRGDQENCSFLDRLLGLCTPGDDIAVLRAMPNGDSDGSFGDGGKAAFDFHDLDEATAVAIDQQDRIVIGGASLPVEQGVATDVEVLRLATNGSLDGSFDHNGSVLFFLNNKHYSAAATVAIDRFGKIVIGAVVADDVHLTTFNPLVENFNATADFALARLNDDGSFDQTFGTDGVAQFVDVAGFDDVPRAMAIDTVGRIVLAGSATSPTTHEDFALVRFTEAGIVDPHYAVNGIVTTDVPHSGVPGSDQVRGLAFDNQGRAVAAGVSSAAVDAPFVALARYQVERPDYSFSPIAPLIMPVGARRQQP
jgi:uncharacterized delta-60 repeat protein